MHVARLLSDGLQPLPDIRSLLTQDKIDDPATPHMLPRLATVGQNVGVGATRFFESIGQDGQAVKGGGRVNRLSQFDHRAIAPRQP